MPAVPVIAAIPAFNEAERIGTCLTALADQIRPLTGAVLLANNCTDQTAAIARAVAAPFRLDILPVTLPPHRANAGTARRLAMQHAAAMAGRDGAVLTTDADAAVPADWVARNLDALSAGADAVWAAPSSTPTKRGISRPISMPTTTLNASMPICWTRWRTRLSRPRRSTAAPHRGVGRQPGRYGRRVAACRRRARGRHRRGSRPGRRPGADGCPHPARSHIRVTVSGRTEGRAPGGMADTMRRRMIQQDE